jgi:peptidyl-dipeptidase Dcp
MVLSRGNTEELGKMYESWRGAPPNSKAMLKNRGLEDDGQAK